MRREGWDVGCMPALDSNSCACVQENASSFTK